MSNERALYAIVGAWSTNRYGNSIDCIGFVLYSAISRTSG
jgi:hypothetical protein